MESNNNSKEREVVNAFNLDAFREVKSAFIEDTCHDLDKVETKIHSVEMIADNNGTLPILNDLEKIECVQGDVVGTAVTDYGYSTLSDPAGNYPMVYNNPCSPPVINYTVPVQAMYSVENKIINGNIVYSKGDNNLDTKDLKTDESDCNDEIGKFELVIHSEEINIKRNGKKTSYFICDILLPKKENCVYGIRILGRQILKLDWIREESNGRACYFDRKEEEKLRKEIVKKINDCTIREYVLDCPGWENIVYDEWFYAIQDGVIGGKYQGIRANAKRRLSYDPKLIGTVNTFQKVLEMVGITKHPSASLPLLLFLHMGMLTTVFKIAGVPIKFLMAYIGETNSKKTSIAKVLTQVFNVNDNEPSVSFMSKECGVEEYCSSQRDSVPLIDDFRPSTSKEAARDIQRILEFLQRSYGDGYVKKRMKAFQKEGVECEFPPEGCCLITGEHMTGVLSSITRTVIVHTDRNQCNNDILSWYQKNNTVLPSHIYDFIAFVTENFISVKKFIADNVQLIRSKTKEQFHYDRFPEYYAQFSTIIDIIFWYAKNRGFMDEKLCCKHKEYFTNVMLELLQQNELDLRQENIDDLFISKVYELLSNEKTKITDINDAPEVKADIYCSDKIYYLKSGVLIGIAEKLYGNSGFSPTIRELSKKLYDNQLIITKKESDHIRRLHKIPRAKEKNARYIWICRDKLEEFIDKKSEEYNF
jgi:hypothetical protein